MKKTYLFVMVIIAALAWSCEEKENMDPVGNWVLNAPVLSAPSSSATVVLDEDAPDAVTRFEWQPATTSNKFGVSYSLVLVPSGTTDYSEALMTATPTNGGKDAFVNLTAAEIDYALWAACYAPGSNVSLDWAVIASSIEKESVASQPITFTRFATDYVPSTLFISGAATEAGTDPAAATPMRAHLDAEGNPTGKFDVYTTLTEGQTYHFSDQASTMGRMIGGADGELSCGTEITAPETGQYRVTVDMVNNTYELLKIEKWSLVGDAVEGGWGGDVPLEYAGNGVWEGTIEFYQPYEGAGFIFRANEDWGYIIKRIEGTATPDNKGGEVFMESEAGDAGITVQDLPGTTGLHKVTLDLSADGYTYSLVPEETEGPAQTIIGQTNNMEADAVTGAFGIGTYETPEELHLLSGGTLVATFTKDGDIFRSEKFLALEAGETYYLNSASDGSGTTFNENGDGTLLVDHDQAYQINVDFSTGQLSWKHYNLKLFHWDEVGGGWDARQEIPMTYVHPYQYEVSGSLFGGYHSKFISPWDIQFGTGATALTGTMTNGGPNYTGISSSGTYNATITISDDYSTAEYSFVKQ